MDSVVTDFISFIRFLIHYLKLKVVILAFYFERFKNWQVELLIFRRGILQKRVWHGSMIGLSAFGVLTSGVFGGQTIISSSFPGVGGSDPRFIVASYDQPAGSDPVLNSFSDTRTTISQKPRSEIIEYEVQSGDTLSGIADKFGISVDTIKWANDISDTENIKPGEILKILPVTGVAHTVVAGDTLQSVAKKYSAQSQAILDFPFNDIPDDFSLKVGQVLIIPDGTPPEAVPSHPQPQGLYYAEAPPGVTFAAPGGANFIWPVHGVITQNFSWYHPGIDIANPAGPLDVAAASGTVIVAGWPDNFGFGNRVVIDHGNGYTTTYAHLANIYVTVGQHVNQGEVIGRMGSTGRSTGTHTHFEIRYHGIAINPLAILK